MLKRNLETEEGREFWANVDKSEEQIKTLPKWMQEELRERKKLSDRLGRRNQDIDNLKDRICRLEAEVKEFQRVESNIVKILVSDQTDEGKLVLIRGEIL